MSDDTSGQTSVNDQQIWFERWLWSYMPIHWIGWAIIFAAVVAGGLTILVCEWVARIFGHQDFGAAGFVVVLVILFGLDPFMRRHSRKFI